MKRFRLLNVLLLALIALATWRTVDVWRRTPPSLSAGEEPPPPTDLSVAPRKPSLPEMVNVIASQDVFDASRQEVTSGVDESLPQATPVPPPTLKLSGVLFVGLEPEAVFTDTAQSNKQVRLRIGEEIAGYKVDRIEAEMVALVTGTGEEVVLPLLIDTTSRGGAVAFGPGGRATPRPNATLVRQASGQRADQPGGFAANDPQGIAEQRREDARRRAERARERLKRLRAEAARNR
jgi:hypothetical protein